MCPLHGMYKIRARSGVRTHLFKLFNHPVLSRWMSWPTITFYEKSIYIESVKLYVITYNSTISVTWHGWTTQLHFSVVHFFITLRYPLGMGWDWVHLVLRSLFGLLYQLRMMGDACGAVGGMRIGRGNRTTWRKLAPVRWWMMHVEQSVEWELTGETEVLGENLPQCHFVHKSHMTWPGLEPGPPRWEAGD
jgi:hypothetical protein